MSEHENAFVPVFRNTWFLFQYLCQIFFCIAECARNYTALQGRLYGKQLSDCEQHIDVLENYMITLYFTSLDFRTDGDCTEINAPLTVSQIQQIY